MSAEVEEGTLESAPPRKRHHHRRLTERRAGRSGFHLPERRTGFDRRRVYPFTGTLRDNPALLFGVLVLINVLSAVDFALTYAELQAGLVEEANPVLARLFAEGPGQAWLFKTGVMLAVSVVIWHQRKHRAMLAVALVALVLYLVLLVYHLAGMMVAHLI